MEVFGSHGAIPKVASLKKAVFTVLGTRHILIEIMAVSVEYNNYMISFEGWIVSMWRSSLAFDGKRRAFLSFFLASLAFWFSPKGGADRGLSGIHVYEWIRLGLEGIFTEPAAARRIGRIYLTTHPDELDPIGLLQDLSGLSEPGDLRALRRRLSELRDRDFANGNIVIVKGWVLARTEARICAFMCSA